MNREYDIIVVGAGAAGVVAACVAAEQGGFCGSRKERKYGHLTRQLCLCHHPGLSLGRCFTFGMIAALHALEGI